ncbi:hypothetical protein VTI74DRAFT_5853 [Chaetomium olivicolor]
MFPPPLPGLVIRQAEFIPGMGHTKLPSISQLGIVPSPPPSPIGISDPLLLDHRTPQLSPFEVDSPRGNRSTFSGSSSATSSSITNDYSFGPESPQFGTHQRLPPISDLLNGVPPPFAKAQATAFPVFPPTPLLSPVGLSPLPLSTFYPVQPAPPPRAQSVPGQNPGFLIPPPQLGPRRASADCIGNASRSFSARSALHRQHRGTPERERQRRNSKQAARLQRRGSDNSIDFHSIVINTDPNLLSHRRPSLTATPSPSTSPTSITAAALGNSPTSGKQKQKHNNKPYTFEQEAFFIYHRVDLDMTWEQVRAAFMARWPGLERKVSGLECAYYRTNLHLPETTDDGLLVLVDPEQQQQQQQQQQDGGGPDKGAEALPGYKYYKGVAYRTKQVKCRSARISLMERFPEELVDEGNEWVREEHRVLARDVAEKRRRQREEFLTAKARQHQDRLVYF